MDLLAAPYHDSRRRPDRSGRRRRGDHEVEWSVRRLCGSTSRGANLADGPSSRNALDLAHSIKPSVIDRVVALIGWVHERVAKWPWSECNAHLDFQVECAYQVGAFDLRRLPAAHNADRQTKPEAQGAGDI